MNYEDFYVWQDREVRFDVSRSCLSLRTGEKVFDTIQNIEDTKGNSGDLGTIIFTNLRLIWYCRDNIKLNLTLGYECILTYELTNSASKLSGDVQGICIKCKFNSNRFEFRFNDLGRNEVDTFSTFSAIYKAYDTSRLYRDVKTRSILTRDKSLITLPGETILNKISNVISILSDSQSTGVIFITNIRVVWFSNSNENLNLSLPWIQLRQIKSKEVNKISGVICLDTGKGFSSNSFNFKFSESPDSIINEFESQLKKFNQNPILSLDLSNVIKSKMVKDNKLHDFSELLNSASEDFEVTDTNYFNEESNMLYYLTSNSDRKNASSDIIYNTHLGLSVQRLPENVSIENLWKIIV